MHNLETLATTGYTRRKQTTTKTKQKQNQHKMCWTPYTQTNTTHGLFLHGFSSSHLSGLKICQ